MLSAAHQIENCEVPADFSSLMAFSYFTLSDGDLQICRELCVPFVVSFDPYPSMV
jgi:hypothetical protein